MPSDTADVLVVGAGPAGAAAATLLARGGRRVILIDKAVFPRDKCCGDGLTTLALRELEALRFDPASVPTWRSVDSAWIRSPSGREVSLPLPADGIFAATAPRRELDATLVDIAGVAGAEIRQGAAFAAIHQHQGAVDVELADGTTISARYVIAADGMWSPVRKALDAGTAGYLGEWHAFRQYARNVTGSAADRLYVWFEPDILPGYAWSFPLPDGRVNIGFGVFRDGVRKIQDMKAEWQSILDRPHIRHALGENFELEDRHTAWPIPARIDKATLAKHRTLFVGDAAMAADVMTGEGIGQALLTGRLAAEAILSGGALDAAAVTDRYAAMVRHHLVADHRMSALLGKVLSHRRGARGAVRIVDTTAWVQRNFARWMFEDEPRAIAFTPSRWHRDFLHQPGPYRVFRGPQVGPKHSDGD